MDVGNQCLQHVFVFGYLFAVVGWSFPGFPDGLVRADQGGFVLSRTLLTEERVPSLAIIEDLDVVKEIRASFGS